MCYFKFFDIIVNTTAYVYTTMTNAGFKEAMFLLFVVGNGVSCCAVVANLPVFHQTSFNIWNNGLQLAFQYAEAFVV